jgi:hypothetical protein
MVTSVPRKYALNVPRGGPVGFSAVALGADMKKHTEFWKKTTPYIMNLRGSDAYVMLRQESGEDMMYVEIRVAPYHACQVTSRFTLIIVRGSQCGGNYLP